MVGPTANDSNRRQLIDLSKEKIEMFSVFDRVPGRETCCIAQIGDDRGECRDRRVRIALCVHANEEPIIL